MASVEYTSVSVCFVSHSLYPLLPWRVSLLSNAALTRVAHAWRSASVVGMVLSDCGGVQAEDVLARAVCTAARFGYVRACPGPGDWTAAGRGKLLTCSWLLAAMLVGAVLGLTAGVMVGVWSCASEAGPLSECTAPPGCSAIGDVVSSWLRIVSTSLYIEGC